MVNYLINPIIVINSIQKFTYLFEVSPFFPKAKSLYNISRVDIYNDRQQGLGNKWEVTVSS
jgi:hypothetical protein